MPEQIKLTQYSHGGGCGCKIAPEVLEEILHSQYAFPDSNHLLVGNHSKDDAAVYDIGNDMAVISTTDFFMPIVNDAFDFGRIASREIEGMISDENSLFCVCEDLLRSPVVWSGQWVRGVQPSNFASSS